MNKRILLIIFIIVLIHINLFPDKTVFKDIFYSYHKPAAWERINVKDLITGKYFLDKYIYYKLPISKEYLREYFNTNKDIGIYLGKIEGYYEILLNNEIIRSGNYGTESVFFKCYRHY